MSKSDRVRVIESLKAFAHVQDHTDYIMGADEVRLILAMLEDAGTGEQRVSATLRAAIREHEEKVIGRHVMPDDAPIDDIEMVSKAGGLADALEALESMAEAALSELQQSTKRWS